LFLCGKLGSRREQINALSGLTYLHDSLSSLHFLADTCAAGCPLSVAAHFTRADDGVSPPGERVGGTLPLPFEGRFACQGYFIRLGSSPTLGDARYQVGGAR